MYTSELSLVLAATASLDNLLWTLITFTKTALVLAINWFTFVNCNRINSATRCKPCEQHVKCTIFGYKIFNEPIAESMYEAASVNTASALLYWMPIWNDENNSNCLYTDIQYYSECKLQFYTPFGHSNRRQSLKNAAIVLALTFSTTTISNK